MGKRMELHSHTEYSNIRLLDSTNKPELLIDRAIELGMAGICITDHEALCGHIRINKYAQKIKEEHPDFKIGLGNEIYLVDERPSDRHYHFILIAKDSIGHKQLRRLSSRAWMNKYYAKGLERVDTLKSDIEEILANEKGHLIASTACLGGELDVQVLKLVDCEQTGDKDGAAAAHNNIVDFILWCKKMFGDDFYLECQPACSKEQITVNKRFISIAKCFNLKMIVTTDAHYLKKEDRFVHKAYLNSKQAEREVDSFYEYCYLQTNEEIKDHLSQSEYTEDFVEEMFKNSLEIYDKIEEYSLLHSQQIPKVEVNDYEKKEINQLDDEIKEYKELTRMYNSNSKVERYWINQCVDKLKEKNIFNKKYLDELEEEAEVKTIIGQKLDTNMFQYPVLLQHYIDLIWECGSPIGVGRGSACSALNHYLLRNYSARSSSMGVSILQIHEPRAYGITATSI